MAQEVRCVMGRRKGGLDFTKDSRRRRKIRGRETVLMLLIFLAAVAVGVFVFLTLKERMNEPQEKLSSEEPTPVATPTEEPVVTGKEDGTEEQKEAGPFGMWVVPTKEDEVEVVIPTEELWMEDFVDTRTKTRSKGIYVTSDAIRNKLDYILNLIDETELNTIVIDIKDDDGRITYEMSGELIDRFGTARSFIPDIENFVSTMKEHGVYLIARVVTFKDPLLVRTEPKLGLHLSDGSVYKDYKGLGWLNPTEQEVLDYYVEIAQNIADTGFDEINFDYIRFPTEGKISELVYGDGEMKKIEAISAAVKYMCEKIKPMGIYVSADLFGAVIRSAVDQRIVGQDYQELALYLDYICPMIYPSHYSDGYYGIAHPDTEPYKMIYAALEDSNKVLSGIPEYRKRAEVRPWLQDFTASYLRHYIKYGPKQVREEIEATYDSGHTGWLLWNAAVNYTAGALMTEEDADYAYEHRPTPTPSPTPTIAIPTKMPNAGQYIDSPWKKGE